jgi:hypothetical protein
MTELMTRMDAHTQFEWLTALHDAIDRIKGSLKFWKVDIAGTCVPPPSPPALCSVPPSSPGFTQRSGAGLPVSRGLSQKFCCPPHPAFRGKL